MIQHQRLKQVIGLTRPSGLHEKPRDQRGRSRDRGHAAEDRSVSGPEPIKEFLVLIGIARVPRHPGDEKAQGWSAWYGAQKVEPIGSIAELVALVPLGLGQLAVHFVRGPNSLAGLGVATPSGLDRRPSQDEPISFQQSRAQRQAIASVPLGLFEVSIEREGVIEAARRDPFPRCF